jgi:hypothetical protein
VGSVEPVGTARTSQLHDSYPWNQLKVPSIGRAHAVTQLKRRRSYEEVSQRDLDTLRLQFAVNLPRSQCNPSRQRLDSDSIEKVIQEELPCCPALGGLGPLYSVSQFHDGDDRERDLLFACNPFQILKGFPGGRAFPFG